MTYVKPQVLVHQEFRIIPTEITDPLRAHISGPHANLHRYSDEDEKPTVELGAYDYLTENCYSYPGRAAGSVVDDDYTKLYIDDALLMYFEDTIGSGSTISAVAGRSNWIQSSAVSFKSNGSAYPRDDDLFDRDAKLGDTVYLRSVSQDADCEETELWTYITGFASDTVASQVMDAESDVDNQEDVDTAELTIEKIAGPDNCITAAVVDPSDYSGLVDGDVEEEYTIEVIKSSVAGCSAARLRITSASGNDDVSEVAPEDFGEETEIGTRGLKVIFSVSDASSCSVNAETDEVAQDEFVVGQKWKVTVSQVFEGAHVESGGEYDGDVNDTYVIECTKGGLWADLPEITVTTVKGLDFSGPTEVTGALTEIPIGSKGVTVKFYGTGALGTDSSASDPTQGLCKGDKWYVTVVGSSAGPVRRLILKHDLPAAMQAAADLDLRLFIKDDIQVSANRIGFAPLVNYELEATQICVKDGIMAYHSEWTDAGVEQALEVRGGTLYVEYREWLATLCDQVGSISDVADLDQIAGPLDPDNPLKWGVFKALENSNGTAVKYTAVCEPDDSDSWVDVLNRIKGRDDLYNLVPLTFDRTIQNLYAAHADAESSADAGNWKACVFGLEGKTVKQVGGKNALIGGVAGDAIEDDVLATLKDNPQASNTQYTLLQVTTGNGHFITNDVEAGDIVRFLYTVDDFGNEEYTEFVVDSVISEDALLLHTGHDAAVNVGQKIEIWHTLDKDEISEDLATQAGSFSNRRVVAVWPDVVGSGGTDMPGYYAAAIVAGLVSGVAPHQGLTNVEVSGVDDLSKTFAYFNADQLNRMAEAGVWILTEDRDGTPHTRHGLTTDNLDLNRREEMIRRNVDSMSYFFLRRLRPFIGRANVTPTMIERLRYELNAAIKYLARNGFTEELGSQLISGEIRTLAQNALLKDRIDVVLDLVVPAPLNNIELHLVV